MNTDALRRAGRRAGWFVSVLAALALLAARAAALPDSAAVPHLDRAGQAAYRQFLASAPPRAFAVAAGGAWGWAAEADSSEQAAEQAVKACQAQTRQTCLVYALDHRLVFDQGQWSRSWGPYLSKAAARGAPIGTRRGERFPDLAFFDDRGKGVRLADLRGTVVVLHFWGSWCPPCQREMPDLARTITRVGAGRGIRFVLLQVREDFTTARNWAEQHLRKPLPLHDSGARASHDSSLTLADGRRLPDRDIAAVFPTTYVLDRHGVVVFSHVGPLADWSQTIPFLLDTAARSGR